MTQVECPPMNNACVLCYRLGMLDQITSRKLRDAFHNPKSAEHIEELSDAFVEGCKNGTYREQGFSKSTYGMSKVAQMSYTKWLAGQVKSKVCCTFCLNVYQLPQRDISEQTVLTQRCVALACGLLSLSVYFFS